VNDEKGEGMTILYKLDNGSYIWDSDEPEYMFIDEQITAMRMGWAKE
jgi:hypothetical protein